MEIIGYGIIVYAVLDALTKVFLHVVPDYYYLNRKKNGTDNSKVLDDILGS